MAGAAIFLPADSAPVKNPALHFFPAMKALCLALALLPLAVCAEDFTLADGTKFTGTVKRVDPDGLIVETVRGVEKLPFYALTEEDAKRFGFDRKAAEEFRLQQKAARAKQLAEQVAAVQARSAALEKKIQDAPTPEQMAVRTRVTASGFTAAATVTEGTADGVRVRLTTQHGKAAATQLEKSTLTTVDLGAGFIYGVQGAEGDTQKGTLYPAGYYQYPTEFGPRTLRAYATTVEAAIAHGATGAAAAPGNLDSPRDKLPGNLRGGTLLDAPRKR